MTLKMQDVEKAIREYFVNRGYIDLNLKLNQETSGHRIATTLEEGSVQVRLQDEEEKTYHLVPDEQLLYYIESGDVDVKKVVSADYSDWREGGLLFDNYSFKDIIRILQRTYGLNIHLQTSAYNENLLTVHFNKNESVENIFMLLKELIPGLEYKIDGKNIYLR